jgi:hypothetical protein
VLQEEIVEKGSTEVLDQLRLVLDTVGTEVEEGTKLNETYVRVFYVLAV